MNNNVTPQGVRPAKRAAKRAAAVVMVAAMVISSLVLASTNSAEAQSGCTLGAATSPTTDLTQAECDVLVTLYTNNGGPNWLNNHPDDWNVIVTGGTTNPCNWSGIRCDWTAPFGDPSRQYVLTRINLRSARLTGTIPLSLANLPYIEQIDFGNSNLTGTIPVELASLTTLRFLYLWDNQLTGTIPPELGNLTNLTTLNLGDNQLTGTIPPELGNLTNLTSLSLRFNELTGSIPSELGNLTDLRYLSLWDSFDGSQSPGPIPPELGNLTQLITLDLSRNRLSGPIPPAFGNFTDLTSLKLNNNELTGPIPATFGNLTNLTSLSASYNQLSGPIPASIGNLVGLRQLSVHDNALSGEIPPELGGMTELRSLLLSDNQLTGSIPPELGNLPNIEQLWLGRNLLTGPIPFTFGNSTTLEELLLSDNQLTGSIPASLGNATTIDQLYLSSNFLSGVVPPTLTNLTLLANSSDFNLDNNSCLTADAATTAWLTQLGAAGALNTACTTPPATDDADGDGLLDDWEINGYDYDGDGTIDVDLPAMGADPQHKDIFVEVDWMERPEVCDDTGCIPAKSFAPMQEALDDVVESFATAPVTNPDGVSGITLHIDAGSNSIMDPTTGATWGSLSKANAVDHYQELGFHGADGAYNWSKFHDIKVFNIDIARRDIFHYAMYADMVGEKGISGTSRGAPGSDFIVSDGAENWGGGFTRIEERGTFQHELGHNLGLYHDGTIDGNLNYSEFYKSVMNYHYQLVGVPTDNRTDYSDDATSHDDWSALVYDGGSIGGLGAGETLPMFTDSEELDFDQALASGFFVDGDGLVAATGPTTLFVNQPNQTVTVDVANRGLTTATYTIVTSEAAVAGQTSITVPPNSTRSFNLSVNAAALNVGDMDLEVTLIGVGGDLDGELLSRDLLSVSVVDLSDPSTQICDGKQATINMNTNGGNGTGTPGDDVIIGTPGNDTIDAGDGNDTVCALDGDDIVIAGAGDDTLFGGNGNDIMRGNEGVDVMTGSAGNDRLLGGIDGDTLIGGAGDDFLGGFGGADTINGGDGKDTIFGGFGADTINGGPGNDKILGLVGNDTINGGPGNDNLNGDRGADTINGGDGNDTIKGGNSDDVLDGQAGDDTISGGKADDSMSGGSGTDTCTGNQENVADTADATCEAIFGVP